MNSVVVRESPASQPDRVLRPTEAELGGCLLVASSGGHLLQLHRISRQLDVKPRHWVTFDTPDSTCLLEGENVTYAFHPTNRSGRNLLRNTLLAARLLKRLRPAAILTTGAGVAVPFCWLGRATGCRVIYVESFTRIEALSLSGRLSLPTAHRFFVQWPELAVKHSKAEFRGSVL